MDSGGNHCPFIENSFGKDLWGACHPFHFVRLDSELKGKSIIEIVKYLNKNLTNATD